MSDYNPITGELRERIGQAEHIIPLNGEMQNTQMRINLAWLKEKLDAIDAIHAGLERENAALRERLAEMDNRGGSMHIGEATVTVKPVLDWSGVAHELRAIADTLAGEAS